jgi:hypothetical protein
MSVEDDRINQVLADIERSERELQEVYFRHMTGGVLYQHFYLYGIARRALAQSSAFRQMIAAKNSLVALSLVRLQLDTVLRLYALFWVADSEQFAHEVFKGTEINKLKAADGSLLSDRYLKKQVAKTNDWMPAVYAETSGYIHFSQRHILAALSMKDAGTREAQVQIGPNDSDKPLRYYGEPLRAFLHLNMMLPVAVEECFARIKANGRV